MKRLTLSLTGLAVMLYLSGALAFAQEHHGGGGGHGPVGSHGKAGSKEDTGKDTSGGGGKAVSAQLKHNTKLASKLESLLGLSGPTASSQLQTDAGGFKHLGQFVAAVHVSKNLGIDFNTLKSTMQGADPGKKPMSLGQAIATLDPKADPKAEAKKARKQAADDIKESESGS